MRSSRRQIGVAIAFGMAVLWALPGVVSADCNGPTCGETAPAGVEGVSAFVFFAILVAFGTLMAIAEARRR
jgi:hypothetical protein